MISYDDARHTYSDDKGILPSVTQIIEAVGLRSTAFYKEGAADRGKAIHRILHEIDLGKSPDWREAEQYIGYIEAWTTLKGQLKEAQGYEVFTSECIGSHPQKRYAGTVDKVFRYGLDKYCIFDIKTGKKEKWHTLQVTAYTDMMRFTHMEREWTMPHVAYLREDGTFIVEDCEEVLGVWDACLKVYYFGRKS